MTRSTWTAILCPLALVSANVALATPTEEASLNNCQNAVKAATAAFVNNKVAALAGCLQAIATQMVKDNAIDASAAASTCVTQFRKLSDSRSLGKSLPEKLSAGIAAKCTPGGSNTHTLGDILGVGAGVSQPLNADDLNAWCSHYGGDGSIDTLQEWMSCLSAAAECDVDSAIAAQYPRVLDWLNLVRPSMQALTPPGTDPNKITDAVAGLDAVKAEIDGPNNDGVVSVQCGDNGVCDANLSSCNSSLGTSNGNLSTCNANYSSCSGSLATCNAGTATTADVLSGKTFSSSAGLGVAGTVPTGANVSGGNGLKTFTIPNGLYSGSETATANDTNLVPGNIANGVSIFGVMGTAVPGGQSLKTGQTACYNTSGAVIACSGTGQDGDMQRGLATSYVDNGDGTISDTKTGLMWEKLDKSGTIHDVGNNFSWATAFSKIAALNTPSCFAGFCDWRLPNVKELTTLIDYGVQNPAIDPAFSTSCAPGCTVTTCSCTLAPNFMYWSSTTLTGRPGNAWLVDFYTGSSGIPWSGIVADDKTIPQYLVRAVRGGA